MQRFSILGTLVLSSLLVAIIGCESPDHSEPIGKPVAPSATEKAQTEELKKKAEEEEAKRLEQKAALSTTEKFCPLPKLCVQLKGLLLDLNPGDEEGSFYTGNQNLYGITGELLVFSESEPGTQSETAAESEDAVGASVDLKNLAMPRAEMNNRSGTLYQVAELDLISVVFYDDEADFPILLVRVFHSDQGVEELPFLQIYFELEVTERQGLIIGDMHYELDDEVRGLAELSGEAGELFPEPEAPVFVEPFVGPR